MSPPPPPPSTRTHHHLSAVLSLTWLGLCELQWQSFSGDIGAQHWKEKTQVVLRNVHAIDRKKLFEECGGTG